MEYDGDMLDSPAHPAAAGNWECFNPTLTADLLRTRPIDATSAGHSLDKLAIILSLTKSVLYKAFEEKMLLLLISTDLRNSRNDLCTEFGDVTITSGHAAMFMNRNHVVFA